MNKFRMMIALALCSLCFNTSADEIATLRNGIAIDQEATPIAIPKVINEDIRPKRSYPMQPPLIPHDIRGYEVNLQVNKCMSCHARGRIEESQAPMISVTHFMDREGNFLAEISPRRYFCNQCHVTQTAARLTVENDFEDMDELISERDSSVRDD
jgi:cytochrome c-type protein NapB